MNVKCSTIKHTLIMSKNNEDYLTINKKGKWITNFRSRKISHLIRSKYDCIISTSTSINKDNSLLNCRISGLNNYKPDLSLDHSANTLHSDLNEGIQLVKKLIETGYTGRKGKGGFYRMKKTDSGKIMEAINLETGEYSTSQKIDIKSDKVDLKALINRKDKYGDYAWSVLSKIIKYASSLVPGITKEFNDIDEAMRLGFNWAKGPFEMLEEIGVKNFFDKVDEYKGNNFLENLSNSKDNFVGSLSLSIANLAADINPIFFSLANSFNSCIDLSPKPRFGVFNILSNAKPSSKLILALK